MVAFDDKLAFEVLNRVLQPNTSSDLVMCPMKPWKVVKNAKKEFPQAADHARRARNAPAPLKGVQLIRETLRALEWCFKSLIPAPA